MYGRFGIVKFSWLEILKMSYYAVAKGRVPGVYRTWDDCKSQVDKFPGAVFKKFTSKDTAENFIVERGVGSSTTMKPSFSNSSISNFLRSGTASSSNSKTTLKRPFSSLSTSKKASSDKPSSPRRTKKCPLPVENSDGRFKYDSDGYVDVFTDGACSSNGYKGAKAGYGVYFGENHFANLSEAVLGRQTNNNAEIQAVTAAAVVAHSHGVQKLRINTDSQFLINCVTKWMTGWKKRGWKLSSGGPVANRIELEEMDKAIKLLDVKFNHVKGHSGIHGNEMADKLARMGAEQRE